MSERRCEHCGHAPCLQVTELCEPQEGASGSPSTPSAGTGSPERAPGVPSCDSELGAIREDDERDGLRVLPQHVRNTYVQHLMTQRRALLRMVDELTGALRDEKQGAEQWLDRCRAALKERDFQAQRASDAQTILSAVSKERDDLRAKLAEVEKNYDFTVGLAIQRAEAAEARVRELESGIAGVMCDVIRRL